MTLEEVAARVEAATGPVRWQRNGAEFKARCPTHDDRTPSATFKLGEKGDIIAFCFGCSSKGEAIANALGMDIKEWFAQPANGTNGAGRPGRPYQAPPNRQNGAQRPALVERKPLLNPKPSRFRILDPDGTLIAVHQRIDGVDQDTKQPAKRMWWELPDGTKGLGSLPTASLPLYGCQLLRDHPDEEMPVLAEGEKAAQALIRCGLPAVGTVCGAAATPSDETLRPLTRFACVTLWPDNDEPGRAHMNRVAAALRRIGQSGIYIVETGPGPKGEDAADIADENERRARVDAAKEWAPPAGDLTKTGQTSDLPAIFDIPWEDRSLARQANRAYLERSAIVEDLLYSSAVSMITGGKHAGKSTLTRYMAICIAQGREFLGRKVTQGPVYYVASEDETMTARQELDRLGWGEDDQIKFLSSSNVNIESDDDLNLFMVNLAAQMKREGVALLVLDMLFDFVHIRDEMGYAETRKALGKIQKVASDSGSHVVVVHHAPKHATFTAEAAVTALGSQGLAARVSPIILTRRHGPGVHSVVSTEIRDPRGRAVPQSRLSLDAAGMMTLGGPWKDWMQAEVYKPQILEVLGAEEGQELTAVQLAEQLDTTYRTIAAGLSQLYKEEKIGRSGSGKKGSPFRYSVLIGGEASPAPRRQAAAPAEAQPGRLFNED